MNDKPSIRVAVPDEAIKHLARNIPEDFEGYCDQIRRRFFPHGRPVHGLNSRILERMHHQLISLCFPEGMRSEEDERVMAEKLFEIYIRYEAILVSVDQSISPIPVHGQLQKLLRSIEKAMEALDDETRDSVVIEMGEYSSIDDVPVTKNAFDNANSLAEKVTIARQVIGVSLFQIKHMTEHFDYKRRLLIPGKPPKYAFAYAVFALAEVFEEYDQQERSASVNEKVSPQAAHWTDNYSYSGAFLDFVTAFFRKHNPIQIDDHIGNGFAGAVRKMAQRRKGSPELHLILHGKTKAQEVIDFMIGIDSLR